MTPVFRFAPSPNGHLHLGHAYSALLNFDLARRCGGRFLLRIEDIDPDRCKPEFEAAIYQDLDWLGIRWESPVRRQSQHFDEYRRAVERLDAIGLIYPSFESRAQLERRVARQEERERRGHAIPMARRVHAGNRPRARRSELPVPPRWRLDMAAACVRAGDLGWVEQGQGPGGETGAVAAHPDVWGDAVLARQETPTSYHLSVVIDDALQGVTEVVRGQDLFWSTSLHRLLQDCLACRSRTTGTIA